MYFLTYITDEQEKLGIISHDGDHVIPIQEIMHERTPKDMIELIKNFTEDTFQALSVGMNELKGLDINNVKITAPIPNPGRGIICLGKNYREHIKEVAKAIDSENEIPEYPVYFSKLVDRAVGMNEVIPVHKNLTESLDYEAELAVIIGKDGRDIPMDKVEEYIFGYTIVNDISAREIQRQHKQWFRGKSLDGSTPMGPYIAYKDLVSFPVELNIKSYVNGELRQNSNTREFLYNIPYVISEFSKGITLKAGDIISTGTPAGVGMGFNPPKYLKSGDIVECYIEKIGTLRNKVL